MAAGQPEFRPECLPWQEYPGRRAVAGPVASAVSRKEVRRRRRPPLPRLRWCLLKLQVWRGTGSRLTPLLAGPDPAGLNPSGLNPAGVCPAELRPARLYSARLYSAGLYSGPGFQPEALPAKRRGRKQLGSSKAGGSPRAGCFPKARCPPQASQHHPPLKPPAHSRAALPGPFLSRAHQKTIRRPRSQHCLLPQCPRSTRAERHREEHLLCPARGPVRDPVQVPAPQRFRTRFRKSRVRWEHKLPQRPPHSRDRPYLWRPPPFLVQQSRFYQGGAHQGGKPDRNRRRQAFPARRRRTLAGPSPGTASRRKRSHRTPGLRPSRHQNRRASPNAEPPHLQGTADGERQ